MTMQKIEANSPEAQSADLLAGNLAQLKALFPELITEGASGPAINVDVLKALIGDQTVTDADEKYGLNWHGKKKARQIALTPSTGTLRPCPEDSVDWDTTQNLMIEGDNLEVLKLLQKSYSANGGQVKLIYIDPPYNTGSDFVYPDNFQDNIRNYLEITGQVEGGIRISSNTDASGRFHSDWLSMIYPRLQLAWSLLRKDGFIVVSIDDRELGHLRSVMNELYGEENFVGVLVFDRNRKNDAKLLSVGHEYMVVYARNKALLKELDVRLRSPKEGVDEVRDLFDELRKAHGDDWAKVLAGLKNYYSTIEEDDPRFPLTRFTNVDERGPFRTDGNPSWPGGGGPRYDVIHPVTGQVCKVPGRGWVWPTFERMKKEIDAGNIVFGADHTTIPSVRMNLFEKSQQVMRSVQFSYAQKASQDFAALFDGKVVFQNPKSYRDIQKLVSYFTEPGDLILDFFAGSGTTGHGVMLADAEGLEKQRKFILVQIPEPLDLEDDDQRLAAELCLSLNKPLNLAEVTKERLRRAAVRVKSEAESFTGDFGFRVFKLDTSNIRAWNPKANDLKTSLFDHLEHLEAGRSSDDILYEILLKLGLDLCVPIKQREIAGKQVNSVGEGVLMACLVESIKAAEVEALALGIVAWRKEQGTVGDTTAVFRDSAFENDVAKSNLAAILEQHGIKQVRSL